MTEIYSRHKNGGGKIGRYVTISPGVYVSEDSVISGRCELYGSTEILASSLSGWCRITGGSVHESTLDGFVQFTGGRIHNSYLAGDIAVVSSRVLNCDLRAAQEQQIRVVENATLDCVSCCGPIFVSGATASDCELLPYVRVLGGHWNRSPRIKRSPFQYHVVESHMPGNLLIGCWDRPLDIWRRMVEIYKLHQSKPNAGPTDWIANGDLDGYEALSKEELDWYGTAIEGWEI